MSVTLISVSHNTIVSNKHEEQTRHYYVNFQQTDAIQIIRDHITSGVYKPSTTAYHLHWFCILKANGKSLCLIHDLQPLNAVTICDSSIPPFVEHLMESFTGYVIYFMLDLAAGFDQWPLTEESWDTTFNSPLGPHHLTTILMDYTNTVRIYQADMVFILQDKIPQHTTPFVNDVPGKSIGTNYQDADGNYETIPDNPGIRRCIWEHLQVAHRIIQRQKTWTLPSLHTLQAVHIFIFGIANLTVEMDAKYVKGMINNPDLQPNVTINRWIMGILLFHFHPEHVPTTHHTGPDGLSWWLPSENNPVEEDDFEDWIDNAYSFMISLMNTCTSPAVGTTDHHRHTTHTSEMPSHNLSVLISATLDTSQTNPTIPHSHKAVTKESCIDNIHDFLNTRIHPTDLSDADYKSFINAATRFFILNNALYHWKPHGCHQLVILIAHRYRLIWEAHDSLGHKGVFSVCYTSVTDDRGKRAKSPSK